MLHPLLGSENCERVLIFLLARNEGYAREISNLYDVNLYGIQRQLDKLELGNVVVSRTVGRTRVYSFNPRYPFLTELKALLNKAFSYYSEDIREKLVIVRLRPRRRGKPL